MEKLSSAPNAFIFDGVFRWNLTHRKSWSSCGDRFGIHRSHRHSSWKPAAAGTNQSTYNRRHSLRIRIEYARKASSITNGRCFTICASVLAGAALEDGNHNTWISWLEAFSAWLPITSGRVSWARPRANQKDLRRCSNHRKLWYQREPSDFKMDCTVRERADLRNKRR